MRRGLALGIVCGLLAWPAAAPGHGGEDEALEKTPARALAQQALALLSEGESTVEAHERVEAALESEDQEGVDLAKLRETQDAFDAGDHDAAARLLDEALADPAAEKEADESAGESMEGMDAEPPADDGPSTSSFEHAKAYTPGRGTSGWIGGALGLLALGVAGGLLVRDARATG